MKKFILLKVLPAAFVLFAVVFFAGPKVLALTVNFQGHLTGGSGGCTTTDSSECSNFENTVFGQPGFGTYVYNCAGINCAAVGSSGPITGGNYDFSSQNVTGSSPSVSGSLLWTPGGATPVAAEYVCDVPGYGTGIPYSAPISANSGDPYAGRPSYEWSGNVPSDASCSLTIRYATEPNGSTNPASCTSGCARSVCNMGSCQVSYDGDFAGAATCSAASDCQTNLTISINPNPVTINQGDGTAVYNVTFTFAGSVKYDWINIRASNASIGNGNLSWSGTGLDTSVPYPSPNIGRVKFVNAGGAVVTSRTLQLTVNSASLGVNTYPISISAETGDVSGVNMDWTFNYSNCYGTCSPSSIANLIVQNAPCRNFIVGGPTRMVCDQVTATSYRIRWTAGTWNGIAGQGIPTESRVRASLVKNDVNTGCGVGSNCVLNLSGQSFDLASANVTGLQPGQTYFNRVAQLCTDSGGGNLMYKDEPDTIGWGGNPADWTCTTLACNSVTFNSLNSGVSTNSNGPPSSNISLSPNGTYYAFCDYGVNANDITLSTSPAAGCVWDGSPGSINGTRYRYTCTAPSSPQTVNISCTMNNDGGPDYFCSTPNTNFATVTVSGTCVPGATRTVGSGVCTGIETCDAGGNWPGTYDYSSTNGNSCNDSLACNGPDVCSNGVCSGGAIITGNVTLTPSTINTGSTSIASVSGGWTNVNYSSSNTAVATVSGSTLTGVAGGSSSISGTGTVPGGYDNNCSINPATLTVNPPVCPSSGNTVSLSSNNTTVGSSVTASAPVGWSGGSFVSNDNSKATVSGNTVTGQGVGSASISGNNNWTAPNGAVNCGLNPATITVGAAPYFDLNILEATQTVTQGGSASYTVELTSQNSFSGTVTLSNSGCPTNATCTFAGGNSAVLAAGGVTTKYLDVVTQVTTPANSYTLGATGVSGVLTDSDTAQLVVDALPTPPTVDLKCNGQDNPTIDYGANCDLTWTTTNGATSCTASGNWSGAKAFAASNGPDTQSGLTANRTYTITCSNGGGAGAPDTVNVTVRPQGPGGGGGGGGGTCGQINLTWNNVSGEAGYNVYRNTVNSSSTAALLSPANAADDTTFTDSPGSGTFYYWVTYFTNPGAFESSKAAILNNPLGGSSCDGSISTDKDITTINGNTPSSYTPSVGNGNQTPANVTYNKNDIIGFSINILHNGALGSDDATGVFIADKLINLIEPATDWQLQRNGTNILEDTSVDCTNEATAKSTITADRYGVCGAAPNQTIYIKIPDLNQGDITQVTFRAQLAVASGFTQSSSRFQNSATISYTKNGLGETDERTSKTPLLLFNVTSIPSKSEVAP